MVVGISFIHYSHFNLDTDYRHYALARALQGLGYAFFFVPLSVIAYSQLSPDAKQQGLVSHQLLPQLGRKLRHRLHHHRQRTEVQKSWWAVAEEQVRDGGILMEKGFSAADGAGT